MPLSMGLKDTAKKYALMMQDRRVMSHRSAIDVIDARVLELMERVDADEAPERMRRLCRLWADLKEARRNEKAGDVASILGAMDAEFEKAYHDYAAWEQITELFDLRRKLVDSEIKVVKELKAILTAEQAYKLVAKLLAVCIRVVKDPKQLRQINYEFSKIIGEHDLPTAEVVNLNEGEEYE